MASLPLNSPGMHGMHAGLSVSVNMERSRLFGRALKPIRDLIGVDDFTDSRYYPPASADREVVSMYFLVMVAMDHRLGRPGRPYEAIVDGEFYHGADLLYRLGRLRLEEDPDFFTAERLSRVTVRDVEEWLSAGRARPPDPHVRARLLRDLGWRLQRLYDGSAYRIIEESRGYLRRGVGEGFVDRLKVFTAYNDPVEKKPFLLAKFLERRGVLPIHDPQNKEVPVDNHLARIALRTGMVEVDYSTREAIAARVELDWRSDVMLRLAARAAYRLVSQESGIDAFRLDDFLWMFGRRCCTRDEPTCRTRCRNCCKRLGACNGGCILQGFCPAAASPLLMVPEHRFLETWWY